MRLIIVGVFIHLVSLLSIFDIYFKSPIIHDVSPYISDRAAPANRLVLFVADGLRAESLYGSKYSRLDDMKKVSPFLSSVINSNASWGISHTRVPTESRPGHVALAAGFYEDPSAIAKGWRENPVEFDSVFNESKFTWAWGSPDIVPMFSKVSGNHVFAYSYSAEEEDFSGKQSTTLLDKWVFDRVESYFQNARGQIHLEQKLQEKQIIFFLHLLGLDTAGHAHKPYSREHLENIYVVDQGLKKIESIVESYFKDDKTAYIFTADHGMTDWGSHGAGSASETETPFIAWGAGIAHSHTPVEMEQADIAPFISTLIATPIPVNSVGTLPIQCLKMSDEDIAHAIYANAKQICKQFDAKRSRTEKNSIQWLYKPYSKLTSEKIEHEFETIRRLIGARSYKEGIKYCQKLIKTGKDGLDYYQNYYQNVLLSCITFAYIGWIVMLFINLVNVENNRISQKTDAHITKNWNSNLIHLIFIITIFVVVTVVYVQSLPFMYYIYCTLPFFLWWYVCKNSHILLSLIQETSPYKFIKITGWSALCLLGIEILVMCFFHRQMLSVPLLVLSAWPFFLRSEKSFTFIKFCWSLTCGLLSVFPFLPVVGSSFNIYLIECTGILWIIVYIVLSVIPTLTTASNKRVIDRKYIYANIFPTLLLIVALINLYLINKSFQNKDGLQLHNQIISWALFCISLVAPFFGSFYIPIKLSNITLSFLVPFILLSVTYEPLFILILYLNLYFWLIFEHKIFSPTCIELSSISFLTSPRQNIFNTDRALVNGDDFRRAYFFLLYSILAFFGTGNMASINSFDPLWVRNFVTIFSPFTMMSLILFKIIVPYLIISCFFRAVTVCLQAPVGKLFLISLIYCAVMGLHFLHLVKNQGSWLEIGTSISHFIIIQAMVLFLLMLYGIAIVLTRYNLYNYVSHRRKRFVKDN